VHIEVSFDYIRCAVCDMLKYDVRITGCAVVLTATGLVSGEWKNSTPLNRSIVTDGYPGTSATPLAMPNLVQVCPRGTFVEMGEIRAGKNLGFLKKKI